MSYAAIAALAADQAFVARVRACLVQETGAPDAEQVAWRIAPKVAAAPGFADAYLWGDRAAGVLPGQAAITDGQLFSAVESVTGGA